MVGIEEAVRLVVQPDVQLEWNGYSVFERQDLTETIPTLLSLFEKDERLKEFAPTWMAVSHHSVSSLEEFQKKFLEAQDQSMMVSACVAHYQPGALAKVGSELEAAIKTLLMFSDDIRTGGGILKTKFFADLKVRNPKRAQRFQSMIISSIWAHFDKGDVEKYSDLSSTSPVQYIECGIDLMIGDEGPLLSEFQLGSQLYSICLEKMVNFTASNAPFYGGQNIKKFEFGKRRLDIWNRAVSDFIKTSGVKHPRKIVIDAWAKLANLGGNHRYWSEEWGAEFLILDNIKTGTELDASDGVVIYNQPSLFFLDPECPIFGAYKDAKIEYYPELGFRNLFEQWQKGRVFLAWEPTKDVLNDKGIYPFIRDMMGYYLNKEFQIPICDSSTFLTPNGDLDLAFFTRVRDNKDDFVVCHRYLEAGMGIHVGKSKEVSEWNTFCDEVIKPNFQSFVVRPFYKMNPVHSLRPIACGARHSDGSLEAVVSAEYFGRVSKSGFIDNSTQGGVAYLALPSEAQGAVPIDISPRHPLTNFFE